MSKLPLMAILAMATLDAQTKEPLQRLMDRADEAVTVTIDGPTLRALEPVIAREEPKDVEFLRLLHHVKAITVYSLTFRDKANLQDDDIATLRSQVTGQGWSRFLSERKAEPSETVEGWAGAEGLGILVNEPGELTGVRVEGFFPPSYAPALGQRFGLPPIGREKLELPSDAIPKNARVARRHVEKLRFSKLVRDLESQGIHKQRVPLLWLASPVGFFATGGAASGTHLALFDRIDQDFSEAVEKFLPEGWMRLVDVRGHDQRTTIFLGEVGSRLHLLVATGKPDGVLVTTKFRASSLDQEPRLWGNLGTGEKRD